MFGVIVAEVRRYPVRRISDASKAVTISRHCCAPMRSAVVRPFFRKRWRVSRRVCGSLAAAHVANSMKTGSVFSRVNGVRHVVTVSDILASDCMRRARKAHSSALAVVPHRRISTVPVWFHVLQLMAAALVRQAVAKSAGVLSTADHLPFRRAALARNRIQTRCARKASKTLRPVSALCWQLM